MAAQSGRRTPSSRPPRDGQGALAAHAAARAAYLRGQPVDMSALAANLGVGRATLYRWVGNREALLGEVLAELTEQTFRAAVREVDSGTPRPEPGGAARATPGIATPAEGQADGQAGPPIGAGRVLAVLDCFMRRVLAAEPLRALTLREPLLFVRIATSPGVIESRSAALLRELLEQEVAAGHLRPPLPVPMLAQALVRMADGPLYAHLLGGGEPRIGEALTMAAVLLECPSRET